MRKVEERGCNGERKSQVGEMALKGVVVTRRNRCSSTNAGTSPYPARSNPSKDLSVQLVPELVCVDLISQLRA
eukprot:3637857-Rhodomonas_salina.6